MASIRIRPHLYLVLILVLSVFCCSCAAQGHRRIVEYDKVRIRGLPFLIPRGGENQFKDAISDSVQHAVVDVAIGPWIQRHTVLIIKTIISSFFVAQILAYCGVIGEKGEGLVEWAQDNKSAMHATLVKICTAIRVNLEYMLVQFANLPDRAQFVTCVSIGASVFPLAVKTVVVTSIVTLVGFVFAEILNHVGIIGDEIQELRQESETIIRSVKRWIHQKRKIMRKQLHVEALLKAVWKSLEKDRVFWSGLFVGSIASVVLDDSTTTQGIQEDVEKLIT